MNWVSIGSDNALSPIPRQAISAPSHYLNKLQWNFNQNIKVFIPENASESIVCKKRGYFDRGGDELSRKQLQIQSC